MTTAEIKALYLKHAEDFRYLLDTTGRVVASIGESGLWLPKDGRGWTDAYGIEIYSPIAIAAMTESWRERLDKEHEVALAPGGGGFSAYRKDPNGQSEGLTLSKEWSRLLGTPPWVFDSLPEAICAVVESLAAEKRKNENPAGKTCRTCTRCMAVQPNADGYWHAAWVCLKNGAKCVGPDDCCSDFQLWEAEKPKPSAAAMRAAGRAIGALQTNGILVGPWIETTAAIIDEEFNRETNP